MNRSQGFKSFCINYCLTKAALDWGKANVSSSKMFKQAKYERWVKAVMG